MAPVRDGQDEQPAAQPEQPAPGERRELHHEQEREQQHRGGAPPASPTEPEVHGQEHEQRDRQLDAEMVRIAGEGIRPVDARARDRAVDVDLTGAARER